MLILDTDHFSDLMTLESSASKSLQSRLLAANEEVVVTIITVEELLRGWLSTIHRTPNPRDQLRPYARLQHLLAVISDWSVLPWDTAAIAVNERLRPQHRRLGTMDLKIASIAISNHATLLTRNQRDFSVISELICADWLSST